MGYQHHGFSAGLGKGKLPAWQCACGKSKEKKNGMFPPTCGNCSIKGGLRVVSGSAGK